MGLSLADVVRRCQDGVLKTPELGTILCGSPGKGHNLNSLWGVI